MNTKTKNGFNLINLFKELIANRRLIVKLAKNDFKKKYAGSYLGGLWALVQPVVTVLMYYVVFDKIMHASRGSASMPFVLFLTAGLVPWFYFNEALNNGTNALTEYNYLVKKVVFKISILPIVKVGAALITHAFFILLLLVVSIIYGFMPGLYTLQIIYYSFCLFVFVLSLSYTTCSIVVFFKDLSQIINIVLQIGMWATPVLWSLEEVPAKWVKIIKLNPLCYIVNGYRDAITGDAWFFNHVGDTIYFWVFTFVCLLIGATIFKRLKVHFADVL